MELQFLGTCAGTPAKHRNVSSIVLKLLNERNSLWLFDCGEGTQLQILKVNIKPRKIEKIFITHLHGDHIFGLPGLLSSRSFQGGKDPIEIYGPVGISKFILTSLKISNTCLTYKINIIEILKEGKIFFDDKFCVKCLNLEHNIKTFGYRIEEVNHVGKLNVKKLKKDKIPIGPIYGEIKLKKNIIFNGFLIKYKKYLSSDIKGRIITILGDTKKTKNSIILSKNANILIHESTFAKNEFKLANKYFHSTTIDAANIAKESNVNKLILTHISSRYLFNDLNIMLQEAKKIFLNTFIVKDLDIIKVPLEFKKQE